MSAIVRVENLTKVYQTRQRKGTFKSEKSAVEALKGVSMQVCSGEIFGHLGPNVAGKITLIRILTTLLLPTSGNAWINGTHFEQQENKVGATVGCMLMGYPPGFPELVSIEVKIVIANPFWHPDACPRLLSLPPGGKLRTAELQPVLILTYPRGCSRFIAIFSAVLPGFPRFRQESWDRLAGKARPGGNHNDHDPGYQP